MLKTQGQGTVRCSEPRVQRVKLMLQLLCGYNIHSIPLFQKIVSPSAIRDSIWTVDIVQKDVLFDEYFVNNLKVSELQIYV